MPANDSLLQMVLQLEVCSRHGKFLYCEDHLGFRCECVYLL
jgi:hypothetical protein